MKHRHLKYILDEREELVHAIQLVDGPIPLSLVVKEQSPKLKKLIGQHLDELEAFCFGASFDSSKLRRYLEAFRRKCEAGKKPTNTLRKFLVEKVKHLDAEATLIPSGTSKARDFVAFECSAHRETDLELLSFMKCNSPDFNFGSAIGRVLDDIQTRGVPLYPGPENIQMFECYRFLKSFAADTLVAETEETMRYFRGNLSQWASDIGIVNVAFVSRYSLHNLATDVWLCSRDRELSSAVRDVAVEVMSEVSNWQSDEGYWFFQEPRTDQDPNQFAGQPELVPSNDLTAMFLIGYLKLVDTSHFSNNCKRAAAWLARNQNPDGSWCSVVGDNERPKILTTLIALEALRRSGVSQIEQIAKRAEKWLLDQQSPLGFWFQTALSTGFLSIAVLEYFETKGQFLRTGVDRLHIAKQFLRKSEALSREPSENSRRLAVIGCYHGLEMFLYGLVEEGVVNFDIYRKGGRDTIGFREALGQFERELGQSELGGKESRLSFRTQLQDLASTRDGVVHRGDGVTADMIHKYLEASSKFVSKYSQMFLKYDLLD